MKEGTVPVPHSAPALCDNAVQVVSHFWGSGSGGSETSPVRSSFFEQFFRSVILLINCYSTFDNSKESSSTHNTINTDPSTVRIHQPEVYRSRILLQYNKTIPKKNENNPYT
jgi:hypothetical protein